MDKDKLRQAAERLEQEVSEALAAGYTDATYFYAGLRKFVEIAKAGEMNEPVDTNFSGIYRNFCESQLSERLSLELTWRYFAALAEGRES